MAIYLYVKTHKHTGLKYLGKTSQDPFKYRGSGVYWKRHLKKHGNFVDTEILKECMTNDEIKTWGLYYSELWKIVESQEWANMRPKEGTGGAWNRGIPTPKSVIDKIKKSNTGLKRSEETKARVKAARKLQKNISNQYISGNQTESPRKGKNKDTDTGYKSSSDKLMGREITWNDKLSEAALNLPKCSCIGCGRVITVGSASSKHFNACQAKLSSSNL